MNNKVIIDETTDQRKQAYFMKTLEEQPRNEAKNLLLKKVDFTIETLLELKADLQTNGITTYIYDFNFNETDTFFKDIKETVNIMDFLIGKEINRLIDLSLIATSKQINLKEKNNRRNEADRDYNRKIKAIRNKEGTIKFNY